MLNPATLVFMGFVLGWYFAFYPPRGRSADSAGGGNAGAEMGER